jgi:CRP/FNR family transcriptional regulator
MNNSCCQPWNEGVFKDLSSRDKAFLEEGHGHRRYARGEIVFREGEKPEGIYALASGSLRLYKSGYGGHVQMLRLVPAGGLLCYRSLFAGESLSATAEAREPSVICLFERDLVLELVDRSSQAGRIFLKLLSVELGKLRQQLLRRIDQSAESRLARCLLSQPEELGRLRPSRDELAALIGTSPETVSRVFHHLKADGVITIQRRQVAIQDRRRLEALAGKE